MRSNTDSHPRATHAVVNVEEGSAFLGALIIDAVVATVIGLAGDEL